MLENIQKEEITLAFFSCGAACRHMRNDMKMEAVLYKVQLTSSKLPSNYTDLSDDKGKEHTCASAPKAYERAQKH